MCISKTQNYLRHTPIVVIQLIEREQEPACWTNTSVLYPNINGNYFSNSS